jgi:hypothetical protein
MDRRKQMIAGGSALVLVFAAALGLGFTQRDEEPAGTSKVELASVDKAAQQACASTAAYDQLKGVLFADALKVRSTDPENLNTLATHSVVRMEDPVVKNRDPSGAVACSGTFILELPPGAEAAFAGERRLTADVDYTARPAADGSGLVYQINGAERIMAQLADFNLQGRSYLPALEPETEFAEAMPAPPPLGMGGPEEPVPVEQDDRAAEIDRAAEAAERAQRRERVMRAAKEASEARQREQREARAERRNRERRTERTRRAEATPRRSGARPSFNCRYAKTRTEKMVCDNNRLAARDRQMASMFYGALDDADRRTRRELNRTRDRFLAYRERCRSEECVAEAYEGRMREIEDIMAASE